MPPWSSRAGRRVAWLLVSALGAGALLGGCATSPPAKAWRPTGDALADGRTAIANEPARDRVLWQYRTAATALRRGAFAEAKALLDDALLSLGGIPAGDKSARQARSYFHGEAKKAFRGEPYERVMAYYYRGILYWMDGEVDNARACLRSAQLQDSDTENKEYASDYLLLEYLEALATAKLGGDPADALKRAQALGKLAAPPALDPQANVMLFVEFGNGPAKYATGQYREQLRFRPGVSADRSAVLKVNGQTVNLAPSDDLNFQATTRGGRVMDHILGNKAVFKSATDAAGNAALITGAILATDHDTRDVGLGVAAAGLVSKIISAATTPAADVRCWDNLPQYLSFVALRLPVGAYSAAIEFRPDSGSPIASLTKSFTINVTNATRDTVVFVSDKNQ